MGKFCGGIKLDSTFKMIKGVICDAAATSVDISKAITTCGQLWDGALFTIASVDSHKVITLHNSEGEEVGTPVLTTGNCGVGLDGRFFKMANGVVSLQDGFLLTVVATPTDATIKVTDAESTEITPVTGKANVFLLGDIGDNYTLTVSKTGYTTQTQTVANTKDQTITITLAEARGDT